MKKKINTAVVTNNLFHGFRGFSTSNVLKKKKAFRFAKQTINASLHLES